MDFEIKDCIQGSEEWFRQRSGKATASEFSKIITASNGDLSASRWKYIDELIAECFIKEANALIPNAWMDRGIELEPEAAESFSNDTGLDLFEVGFCVNKALKIVGCSPDRLIKQGGDFIEGLEIKCPKPSTQVSYLREGILPKAYKQQVHGSMAVTGLKRWHFYSYCPGLPALHLVIEADEYTEKCYQAFEQFIIDYSNEYKQFTSMIKKQKAS